MELLLFQAVPFCEGLPDSLAGFDLSALPWQQQNLFIPTHEVCWQGIDELITMESRNSNIIFYCFLIISLGLFYLCATVRRINYLERFLLFIFGAFIVVCGVGHHIDYLNITHQMTWQKAWNNEVLKYLAAAAVPVAMWMVWRVKTNENRYEAKERTISLLQSRITKLSEQIVTMELAQVKSALRDRLDENQDA